MEGDTRDFCEASHKRAGSGGTAPARHHADELPCGARLFAPAVAPTYVGVPGAANLVLGVIAVVPLWLLVQFARNYPLAALSLTGFESTDDDGMLP